LTPGIYNYTLGVSNTIGATVYDEVLVTVTVLTIDSPDDILFDYGTTGHNITWSPSSTADSGTWDGSQIVIDLDELTPGIYNYTLGVSNTIGATVYDEVLVTVTGWNWGNLPDPIIFIITGLGGTVIVLVIIVVFVRRR
jgi:hypothetical protein